MKNIIRFTAVALAATMLASAATSCVGDLDVKPIDPNIELPEDVLNSQEAFTAFSPSAIRDFPAPHPPGRAAIRTSKVWTAAMAST